MEPKTKLFIENAESGDDQAVMDLLTYGWTTELPAAERLEIAEVVWRENRARHGHYRKSLGAARLMEKGGSVDRERECLTILADEGIAPALHLLGAHAYQDGDFATASALFFSSKELGYLIGGWAYHRLRAEQSAIPIKYFHRMLAKIHYLRASARQFKDDASDMSSQWEPNS